MAFKLGTKVTGARKEGSGIKVSVENVKDPSKKEEVWNKHFKNNISGVFECFSFFFELAIQMYSWYQKKEELYTIATTQRNMSSIYL